MKNYLGILGDPAKVALYDADFYRIFDQDSLESSFYLLGASESDIGRREYRYMYEKLVKMNDSAKSYSPGSTSTEAQPAAVVRFPPLRRRSRAAGDFSSHGLAVQPAR